ncbi:(pine wood nematode) hypothetical protein [Aphelenchoides besseyi]|nr:(pine wood nematode) hypothetical protein [Aphelenchoides besseyi]
MFLNPIALIIIVVVFLIAKLVQYNSYIRSYPPGPWALPVIGNFLQIDTANPHRSMVKWSKKFGSVFTVWLPKPVVVLANIDAMKEALLQQGDHFSDRPMSFLYNLFTAYNEDGDGIILCRGPRWQAQRRFALRAFRTFGMGKQQMESRIGFHLDRLTEQIRRKILESSNEAAVVDLHYNLAFCFGNIIHDLVMGRHYEEGDPEFLHFKKMIDGVLQDVASVQMLLIDNYPWFRYFLPTYSRYTRQGFALQDFFIQEISRHEENFDPNREPDNFIDCYLRDMKSESAEKSDYLNRQTLVLNAGDLWTGGLETVVTTVRWGILYMIHHPDIQTCCQRELDQVVGELPLTLAHRNRTPYLHAVLDELQRIVNVLPWNIPHCVNKDVVVCAGTTVMPQLGAINFDDRIFPNPEEFDPTRFLNPFSGDYVPSPFFLPFGMGRSESKRACLGESLARQELYLVFGTLLKDFVFEVDPTVGLPSLSRTAGMANVPKPTSYVVKRRSVETFEEN